MCEVKKYDILKKLNQKFISEIKFITIFGINSNEALFVTKDDEMYGFGINRDGCLGLGHKEAVESPKLVTQLTNKQVVNISYGYSHVIAITKRGESYSWGNNWFGQLGDNSKTDRFKPEVIKDMSGKDVIDMSCGSHHSLLLTKTGVVFGFGHNVWGQIGCNNNINQLKPITINGFDGSKVIAISCGGSHSMALTESGIVYSWGSNKWGQLGIGSYVCQTVPHKILLNVKIVKQIVCGDSHSLCLTKKGSVYSFGKNNWGQLGIDNYIEQCFPVMAWNCDQFTEIGSQFMSDISIAKSKVGFCYVWGRIFFNKFKRISIPMKTEFESIDDIFCFYSNRKITLRPIQLKPQLSPILRHLRIALNDPKLSDFKLEFPDNVIYVNMSYLKIRCPEIQTTFPDIFIKSEALLNCYEVWFAFIQYLYTDSLQIGVENAVHLYYLADMCSEEVLKIKCFEIIKNGIEVKNAFTIYSKSMKYGIKELHNICIQFATNHMNEVVMTEAFDALEPIYFKQFMKNSVQFICSSPKAVKSVHTMTDNNVIYEQNNRQISIMSRIKQYINDSISFISNLF